MLCVKKGYTINFIKIGCYREAWITVNMDQIRHAMFFGVVLKNLVIGSDRVGVPHRIQLAALVTMAMPELYLVVERLSKGRDSGDWYKIWIVRS